VFRNSGPYGWADENRYDFLFVLTEPNSGKAPGLPSEKKRKLTQRRGDAKKRKKRTDPVTEK